MAKRPKIRGLYKIESKTTSRIYIGIANSIYRRWENHKSLLLHNKHTNIILQNHVNKYGIDDLTFNILEITDHLTFEELKIKEVLTIKKYKDLNIKLFNLTDGGGGTSGQLAKSCKLKNIFSGEIIEFESRISAANYIGVDSSGISKLLKGIKKQLKGWCAEQLGYDQPDLIKKNRILYHKEHGTVKVGGNIQEFSRKYNLNAQIVYCLFTKPKRYKSYKGWTTYDPSIEKRINKRHRRIACYDKNKNIVKEFDIIMDAAREYNCSASSIAQALKEPFIKTSMKLYWKYLE